MRRAFRLLTCAALVFCAPGPNAYAAATRTRLFTGAGGRWREAPRLLPARNGNSWGRSGANGGLPFPIPPAEGPFDRAALPPEPLPGLIPVAPAATPGAGKPAHASGIPPIARKLEAAIRGEGLAAGVRDCGGAAPGPWDHVFDAARHAPAPAVETQKAFLDPSRSAWSLRPGSAAGASPGLPRPAGGGFDRRFGRRAGYLDAGLLWTVISPFLLFAAAAAGWALHGGRARAWAPRAPTKGAFYGLLMGTLLGAASLISGAIFFFHPLTAFVLGASGLAGGLLLQGALQRWASPRFASHMGVWLAALGFGAAAWMAGMLYALPLLMIGAISGIILEGMAGKPVKPPASREEASGQRERLSGLRWFGATLVLTLIAAQAYLPGPLGAAEREELAAYMAGNPAGAEAAGNLRAHPELPLLHRRAWQVWPSWSGAFASHNHELRAFGQTLPTSRITLNGAELDPEKTPAAKLALVSPLVVHELDHNRQQAELGEAPLILENEYAAWDRESRYILFELLRNPEAFHPNGRADGLKRTYLRQAQAWLKGPRDFKDFVSGIFEGETLEGLAQRGKAKPEWVEFYSRHQAEIEAQWLRLGKDQRLRSALEEALSKFSEKYGEGEPPLESAAAVRPPKGLHESLLAQWLGALAFLASLGWIFPPEKRVPGKA